MAPAYKLTYFNMSGLGESIRWLLNYGGVEFEDNRIDAEKWPEFKDKMPFGQMPLLEHNGKVSNQSIAICRFLGKKFKLNGKDEWEDLEIDAIVDTINDFRLKFYPLFLAEESKKAEEREKVLKELIPYYFERFNKMVKNGYLVGGHLTWADIYFINLIDFYDRFFTMDEISKYPNLSAVKKNVLNVPAIKAWLAKRPQDNFPKF